MKNAKAGQVRYRADKAGIVHCTIGRASFEAGKLKENLQALLADLQKVKPAASKGIYLKKRDRLVDHGSRRAGRSVELCNCIFELMQGRLRLIRKHQRLTGPSSKTAGDVTA